METKSAETTAVLHDDPQTTRNIGEALAEVQPLWFATGASRNHHEV